jgi:hypothetical protein
MALGIARGVAAAPLEPAKTDAPDAGDAGAGAGADVVPQPAAAPKAKNAAAEPTRNADRARRRADMEMAMEMDIEEVRTPAVYHRDLTKGNLADTAATSVQQTGVGQVAAAGNPAARAILRSGNGDREVPSDRLP